MALLCYGEAFVSRWLILRLCLRTMRFGRLSSASWGAAVHFACTLSCSCWQCLFLLAAINRHVQVYISKLRGTLRDSSSEISCFAKSKLVCDSGSRNSLDCNKSLYLCIRFWIFRFFCSIFASYNKKIKIISPEDEIRETSTFNMNFIRNWVLILLQ